jgi:hypothetical protein
LGLRFHQEVLFGSITMDTSSAWVALAETETPDTMTRVVENILA